jgi:hypothetical protein
MHANVFECARVGFMVCSVLFLLLVCLMCYLVPLVRFHHYSRARLLCLTDIKFHENRSTGFKVESGDIYIGLDKMMIL